MKLLKNIFLLMLICVGVLMGVKNYCDKTINDIIDDSPKDTSYSSYYNDNYWNISTSSYTMLSEQHNNVYRVLQLEPNKIRFAISVDDYIDIYMSQDGNLYANNGQEEKVIILF